MSDRKLRVAIVQASPVPLNIDRGVEKAAQQAEAAARNGAKVIAFGETWLGGYPIWLDSAPNAALWDNAGSKELHRLLMGQAIVEGDERLTVLQDICDAHLCHIIIGAHEKRRSSLYNAQIFLAPHENPYFRRKLTPTHGERLIWARGNGSTLQPVQGAFGPLGGLICWEHWMPLARAAMHHQGEVIHIAQWPTVRETYLIAARHYAFEGRCFVLSAGTRQTKGELLKGLESLNIDAPNAKALLESIEDEELQTGGSAIIAPNADILAGPDHQSEDLLFADIDLTSIDEELAALDTDGHYSRPDVFELKVNTQDKQGVVFD